MPDDNTMQPKRPTPIWPHANGKVQKVKDKPKPDNAPFFRHLPS
jgi:hypothetical protein